MKDQGPIKVVIKYYVVRDRQKYILNRAVKETKHNNGHVCIFHVEQSIKTYYLCIKSTFD